MRQFFCFQVRNVDLRLAFILAWRRGGILPRDRQSGAKRRDRRAQRARRPGGFLKVGLAEGSWSETRCSLVTEEFYGTHNGCFSGLVSADAG